MMKLREHFQFGNLLSTSIGVFIALAAWELLGDAGTKTTEVIDGTWPVVQFGYVDKKTGRYEPAVQNVYRDSEKACWSLFIEKVSYAKVLRYDFFIEGGDTGAKIPTTAYLVDEANNPIVSQDSVNGRLKTHPVGEQWHRRYCLDNANRVPDFRNMTITGWGQHQRFPGSWITRTAIPSFTIPAVEVLR